MYLNHSVIYMKVSSLGWLECPRMLSVKGEVVSLLYFIPELFSEPHPVSLTTLFPGKRIRQLSAVNEKFPTLG